MTSYMQAQKMDTEEGKQGGCGRMWAGQWLADARAPPQACLSPPTLLVLLSSP